MAGVPQNFQAISNVLPTYNFTDLASGTGFINFYAGKTVDLYLLSNFTFYSGDGTYDTYTRSASFFNTAPAELKLDVDFDCVLNRPLDIMGKCVLNVPMLLYANGQTVNGYIIAKLRKWDGVTETDIVTNQSYTKSATGGGVTTTYNMMSIDLVVPLTHFKIGETLRLTIEVWGWINAVIGTNSAVGFAHDPMNRTLNWDSTGACPSRLVFQLPVRLNL